MIRRSLLQGATPRKCVSPNEITTLLYALLFKRNGISIRSIDKDTASDLLYAQLVLEAKWLGHFPLFAMITPGSLTEYACSMEEVKLVYPDTWAAIDNVDTFLLNSRRHELCHKKDTPFVHLAHSTASEFLKLFMQEMFVVASAGRQE